MYAHSHYILLNCIFQDDIGDDSDDGNKISTNIVMQLFSPLFMSQWFLIDHKKNPCLSITCENDFTFVFKQVNNSDHI